MVYCLLPFTHPHQHQNEIGYFVCFHHWCIPSPPNHWLSDKIKIWVNWTIFEIWIISFNTESGWEDRLLTANSSLWIRQYVAWHLGAISFICPAILLDPVHTHTHTACPICPDSSVHLLTMSMSQHLLLYIVCNWY